MAKGLGPETADVDGGLAPAEGLSSGKLAPIPDPQISQEKKEEVVQELSGSSFSFSKSQTFTRLTDPGAKQAGVARGRPDLSALQEKTPFATAAKPERKTTRPKPSLGLRLEGKTVLDRFVSWVAAQLNALKEKLLKLLGPAAPVKKTIITPKKELPLKKKKKKFLPF